jgi:hypothetical protein
MALQFQDITPQGNLLKKIVIEEWAGQTENIKHRLVFESDLIVDGSSQQFRIPFKVETTTLNGESWEVVQDTFGTSVVRGDEMPGSASQNPEFAHVFSSDDLLNAIGNLLKLHCIEKGIIPQKD